MPKIDTEILTSLFNRFDVEDRKRRAILAEINDIIAREEEEKANRPPPVKKQFVVMLSDPGDAVDKDQTVGWVMQIPEEAAPMKASESLLTAAYNYNATPKGRTFPVKTVGEACEMVTAKYLKEQEVWVKTKSPVTAIWVKNDFPDPGDAL